MFLGLLYLNISIIYLYFDKHCKWCIEQTPFTHYSSGKLFWCNSELDPECCDNKITGCKDGYFGPNCTTPCRYPSFGQRCQEACNCTESKCDPSIGCKYIHGKLT